MLIGAAHWLHRVFFSSAPQCVHGCGITWPAGRRPGRVKLWWSTAQTSSMSSWTLTRVIISCVSLDFNSFVSQTLISFSPLRPKSALTCLWLSEMEKVSRNCTKDGWSEPFPHYVDVCFFYDNTTDPVRPLSPRLHVLLHLAQTHMTNPLSPTLGGVLCLSQSPVHCRLQHVTGVSDYSHGHPLQIQVSITMWPRN